MLDAVTVYRGKGFHPAEAMQKAQASVLGKQVESIAIPRRFSQVIREIWLLQHRLETRRGKNLLTVLQHPRFRAGYDFLVLRVSGGEVTQQVADWWTEIQEVDFEQQKIMLAEIAPKQRRRRRPKKKTAVRPPDSNDSTDTITGR